MKLIQTVKRYVTGSDKYFEVWECTVDEVEAYMGRSGRDMMKVKSGDYEYSGLYNKWVYEHLVSNEGTPSFIVLWKAPKGSPMLAYVKEIWQDHIEGVYKDPVEPITNEKVYEGTGEAFVYMWLNTINKRMYIGKHKGTASDGYVCSSESMLLEYDATPENFVRSILAFGTDQEMYELETSILLHLGASTSALYYNQSNNLRK